MADNMVMNSGNNQILSLTKDYSKFCDKTDGFYKKLEVLKDIIQTRGDMFSQKKEKYENLRDFQINKIEKEREQYTIKSEELAAKIEDYKAQLTSLNSTFSHLKIKNAKEKQLNQELNEKISKLQLDLKNEEEEFRKTSKNYERVITLYEDFLNLTLTLDADNETVCIYIRNCENISNEPHLVVKILNNSNFKVIKFHPLMDKLVTDKETISQAELMLLICKVQEHLNSGSCD